MTRVESPKLAGISLVEHVGAELEGLGDMAAEVTIGTLDVLPLPPGEPGGRVVGHGRDIRAELYLLPYVPYALKMESLL